MTEKLMENILSTHYLAIKNVLNYLVDKVKVLYTILFSCIQ